ncbi:MAG TPA: energy-coupling factor ABC transporter permease [Syntrophales bacterium]|nr:energy-coupling factor ABC transporter permease [Syntrophales bacterium]
MTGNRKEAIILLGHGSRIPGAGEGMEQVARRMRERFPVEIIEICYMSRIGPHFPEVFESCVSQGATKVVVMPYFLHSGLHMLEDIPELLLEKARKYPDVEIILGKNLGFDECLVDLVIKRLNESRDLRDVREMKPQVGKSRESGEKASTKKILSAAFIFLSAWLLPDQAHAMHISEGILPLNWAALWFALAIPFVAYGLHSLNKRSREDLSFKPLVGLMAAVVFIISCMPIPVPIAGTCSHPCGTAISGILVGPAISVVITAVALLIQAIFLAHGGLSTLGADIVSMGIMGSFVGYFTFKALRAARMNMAVAGFMAGLLADWATYLTTSVELASGIKGEAAFLPLFWKIVIAFIPTQLPLGILEGAITAGMVILLYKKRPDLLVKMRVIRPGDVKIPKQGLTALLFLLLIMGATMAAPVQAAKWSGVDEAVIEKVAKEHGRETKEPLINMEQGDLPLFLFLIAGTVGGFAAGYYWKTLLVQRKGRVTEEKK